MTTQTTALATSSAETPALLTQDQIALITRTVARGATPDELRLFLHAAARTGLDPLMKQIHAVKRWDSRERREVMSIQTGIDGLRLVAERTGNYAPGKPTEYELAPDSSLESATAYVKKRTQDGTWHEIGETAYRVEYEQRTKEGKPTRFWAQMPRVMLAKVAEARALRRAFPQELSGVYSFDEMAQADRREIHGEELSSEPAGGADEPVISDAQRKRLYALWKKAGHEDHNAVAWLKARWGVDRDHPIRRSDYEAICTRVQNTAPLGSLPEDTEAPPVAPGGDADAENIPFEPWEQS